MIGNKIAEQKCNKVGFMGSAFKDRDKLNHAWLILYNSTDILLSFAAKQRDCDEFKYHNVIRPCNDHMAHGYSLSLT